METWPTWLEKPTLDHKPEIVNNVIETAMEIGDKARVMHAAPLMRAGFTLQPMNGERFKMFMAWYFEKLNQVDWFNANFRTGDEINAEEMRILQVPKYDYIGVDQYQVSITVLIRTNNWPTEGEYDTYAAAQ